jgi:hypothetical protein
MTTPKSLTAQARRYLKHQAGWVTNSELATHLGYTPGLLTKLLQPLVDSGELNRKRCGKGGILHWRAALVAPAKRFSIDWPPGFVPQFDTVAVPAYETRRL